MKSLHCVPESARGLLPQRLICSLWPAVSPDPEQRDPGWVQSGGRLDTGIAALY